MYEINDVIVEEQKQAYAKAREIPGLTEQEVIELVKVKDTSLEARNRLAEGNLRHVYTTALKFGGWNNPLLPDFVSAGSEALVRAVGSFDLSKARCSRIKLALAAYVCWLIKCAMENVLKESYQKLHIPEQLARKLSKLRKMTEDYQKEFRREPTLKEIMDFLQVSDEEAGKLIIASLMPTSLDESPGEDSDESVADHLSGDDNATTEPVELKMLRKYTADLLKDLTEEERHYVTVRFGLEDGEVKSNEEAGELCGVKKSQRRIYEKKIMAKLRNEENYEVVKEFI